MAEPVGITGTAAGLVSLGLQLYGEISSYLAAYKGRQQDLDFAKLQCDNLKRCIDAIDAATTSSGFRPTASRDALDASVQGCQRELGALKELVAGLQGPFSPVNTVSEKIRETGRKLAFPFHQKALQELEERLQSTVHVFQVATQTLGLDVILSTHDSLVEVKFAVDAVQTVVEDTRTDIDAMSKNIECVRVSTSQLSQNLSSLDERTATTAMFMAQHAEALSQTGHQVSTHIDDSTRSILGHIGGRFDTIEERLDGIFKQNASQFSNINDEHHQLVEDFAQTQTVSTRLHGFTTTEKGVMQHDSTSESSVVTHKSSNETPLCYCIGYRAQTQRQARWGPVMLQTRWRSKIRHSSKCWRRAVEKNESQRFYGFELTIPPFQWLPGKSIHVFWSPISGTPGFPRVSLGPELSVANIVSSQSSAAFRLLRFAKSLITSWESRNLLADEDRWRLLGATWRRLVCCYVRGQGSPTDVDEEGETLLYSFLQRLGPGFLQLRMGKESTKVGEQALWLAHSLQLLQVPPSPNHNASSHPVALAIMGDWPTETDLGQQVMRKLHVVSHDEDMYGPFEPSIGDAVASRRHFETLKSIPIATAEVLNFPDLQISILRQDESSVSQILKNNSSCVSDTNCFGQNSVHIAVGVGNLKIVQLIVSHANAWSLNSQDYARRQGHYPIEYAVMSHLHSGYYGTDDIECNGCHILDALLQSDCALYPAIFRSTFFGCTREHVRTAACALRKFISYLKERRRRLSEYAKMYLPPTQAAELDLYGGNVLDETAGDVQKALEERYISVPISLRVYDSETDAWPNCHFRSIHSYLSDSATAAYVWQLGFRDLGVDSASGVYELWDSLIRSSIISGTTISKVIPHIHWLLEKGFDLGKPLHCPVYRGTNFASWTTSHLLSAFLARFHSSVTGVTDPGEIGLHLRGEVAHAAMSTSMFDNCRCACALDGCSPLLILLDGATTWERQWDWRLPSPTLTYYKTQFLGFCDLCTMAVESQPWANSSKPSPVIESILRYLTFSALGLRHSCCRLAQDEGIQDWDSEEVGEVMEEQQEELFRLEELLQDLEQDYKECPDLGTFVDGYWGPKVSTVVDELNARKLDEEDMKAAQEIGVTWHSFENKTEERDYSRSSDLNYWMGKLNAILPEPDSHIPLAPDLPVRDA